MARQMPSSIFLFFFFFFIISSGEQHTETDLDNLLYFLRPVSSDHTDFVREFEQDGQKELMLYLIYIRKITFQLECEKQRNLKHLQNITCRIGLKSSVTCKA